MCRNERNPSFFRGRQKVGMVVPEVTVRSNGGYDTPHLTVAAIPVRVRASASPSRVMLLSAQYKAVGGHAEKKYKPPCLGNDLG